MPHQPKPSTELAYLLTQITNQSFQPSLSESLNHETLIKVSLHHRLYPMLYKSLSSLPLKKPSEIALMKQLSVKYQQNTMSMLKLSGELSRMAGRFQETGIEMICLKGPVIALKLYNDLSLRTSKDLDLLVSPDKVEEAVALLLSSGYQTTDNVNIKSEIKRKRYHHIEYVHEQTGTMIELHWRLHPAMYEEPSFSTLWKKRQSLSIAGIDVQMLGDSDLFLFLITHGSRHAWFRLRWLYDVHLLLTRNTLNLLEITEYSKQYNVTHMVGQGLLLANQLFQTTIPKELERMPQQKSCKAMIEYPLALIRENKEISNFSPFQDYIAQKRYFLTIRQTFTKKIMFMWRHIYPNHLDIETIKLPQKLHGLYYILRPFLGLYRRVRKTS